jgi:hypothetical protein
VGFGTYEEPSRDGPFVPFRYDADLLNRHYGVGETW